MAELGKLPTFLDEHAFRVVVESPRGSILKLKYEPEHHVITLSRPLPVGLAYPYDWGFVPSTLAPDGDPLDAIVMWDGISYPGVILPCRPLGVLRVEQTDPTSRKRVRNDRVIAMPSKALRWDTIRSAADFSDRIRRELEQFFIASVAFEGRELAMLGWGGPDDALTAIRAAQRKPQVTHHG
jgi:inorganic pyrophosphatase